jgi:putative Mn2+ efflux pump MntP
MDFLTILTLGLALSMDAFAVSLTTGFSKKKMSSLNFILMPAFFGFFQAIMPIAGYAIGLSIRDLISSWDHWVAFGLLAFVGIKMIFESFQPEKESETEAAFNLSSLLLLSIATSIDALAVGLSFSFLKSTILIPALMIGIITFLVCLAGIAVGKRFGHLLGKKSDLIGGIVLIGIGIKILLEHL